VIDTGVAPSKGIDAKRIVAWKDFIDGKKQPYDRTVMARMLPE